MVDTEDASSGTTREERLNDELIAIRCIYPEEVEWREKNREFVYRSTDGRASFVLRIPDSYLLGELPEVITANAGKTDLRDHLQNTVKSLDPTAEVLDALLEDFLQASRPDATETQIEDKEEHADASAKATVAVWLHHLLNTNKRKQVITPASDEVSGWSKPGYPGVLLFTGPAAAVQAHVKELKALRWQAFQVRLEVDEAWPMPHEGVVEAGSMSELVAGLDPGHRDLFSSAIMRS